ncbi:sensor histidine kinase [Streptomyces sp. HC307]|uniref:sensor histidine kinase n=1 Tax=Streptomyces flavusporus TaxID=3385496 RepID=UPI0039171B28
MRRITDRLGPAPLGELGLSGALHQLADAFDSPGLTVSTRLTPSPLPPLPAAVEVAVYRIAAEALTNVMKHAHAEHAELRVRVGTHVLTLTVVDDGIGCDPIQDHPHGVGLRSMTDRAAEIGGRRTINPVGDGTRVLAVLPRSPSVSDWRCAAGEYRAR